MFLQFLYRKDYFPCAFTGEQISEGFWILQDGCIRFDFELLVTAQFSAHFAANAQVILHTIALGTKMRSVMFPICQKWKMDKIPKAVFYLLR